MEGNEEIKVEEPKKEESKIEKKKKGNGLFTLFACLMTAFIVILSMQIGDRIGKRIADEDINPQPKVTASNNNSDSNSNSNEPNTQPTTPRYYVGGVSGTYEIDEKDATIDLTLFDNGLYIKSVNIKAPGCGPNYVGNYYIDGDGITLNNLISFGCDAQAEVAVSEDTGKIAENKITLKDGTLTKTNQEADYGKTTKEFVENYIFETIGQGYAVQRAADNQ